MLLQSEICGTERVTTKRTNVSNHCQVRTSYLPSEIGWGERLVPLIVFHKKDGRYCIDFDHFHDTTKVEMPSCSAKAWHERCQTDIEDGTTVSNVSDYPASFQSKIVRSVSFPSQPTQRSGFPLVGKRKRAPKVTVQQSAKFRGFAVRSRSCTEMVNMMAQPLKQNASSAVALYQPASPARRKGSDTKDDTDTDSGTSSPPATLTKVDSSLGGVHFQLEDIEEDGLVYFSSPNDPAVV